MGDGLRTVRVLTTDDSVITSARASVEALEGWEVAVVESQEDQIAAPPAPGDVLLIDPWISGENVYEYCRRLTGKTRCRTFILVERDNTRAAPIARFSGATGTVERPLTPSTLSELLENDAAPSDADDGRDTFDLPESLLRGITSGTPDGGLIQALIDSVTGLFNYAFLNYKLDEEFKRAQRFETSLACVMLGFEGQASDDVLRELAAIFLVHSRDTDVLGRFDESSFLFLLPSTGPDGASVMAHRVGEMAEERGLKDLVGDPLQISVGIACFPQPDLKRREDLYGQARDAFLSARREGGGVVVCS
ncbi:MAG: GGDEF domain-containing protein [bacterium]|nr:GGDEF domain-containing protein [bacterium]